MERLARHPNVELGAECRRKALVFHQGAWRREIYIDRPDVIPSGLIELMDNNPLVCADCASVPSAGPTLALIVFGPLIRANSLLETPTLSLNFAVEERMIDGFLSGFGWNGGVDIDVFEESATEVCAAVGMARIRTPAMAEEIDALYEEAYGRSFYVRRSEDGPWDGTRVVGKPHAELRLRYSPGEIESLLTIQVMADPAGKCGAAQVIHMMNVMAGFEETLGIS